MKNYSNKNIQPTNNNNPFHQTNPPTQPNQPTHPTLVGLHVIPLQPGGDLIRVPAPGAVEEGGQLVPAKPCRGAWGARGNHTQTDIKQPKKMQRTEE